MLTTTKKILTKANKNNYAVPAFNINNLETLQPIMKVCNQLKSPVIIQTSEGAIDYAGIENLIFLVKIASLKSKIPIALHLDHGKDMKLIKKAIDSGYTSVMIDASHYKFHTNIALTKEIVEYAHKKNVSVEAELGTIGGKEDKVKSKEILLTDPEKALDFVKKTKVDSLAVAIGTSHGAYKFKTKPKLDIKRLKQIKKLISVPLVLHGASSIPQPIVKKINKFGGKVKNTKGNPDSEIKKAISAGINKINIDSDLRLAFTSGLRENLKKNPENFDLRKYLNAGKLEIEKIVRHKINLFGCGNQ
jgi:fructose-bisphosphate aldolase class II